MSRGQNNLEDIMIKLFKFVDGKWQCVDFGVAAHIDTYCKLGYIVEH